MAQTVVGTLTNLSDTVEIPTGDQSGVGIKLVFSGAGTVVFEQCVNPGAAVPVWDSLYVAPNGGGAAVTSATGSGLWKASGVGTGKVRVRFSVATAPVAVEITSTSVPDPGASAVTGGGASEATLAAVLAALSASYDARISVTRPANTTPYTAGDVVGGVITFTGFGVSGGGAIIVTAATLEIDVAAIPTGMTGFTLHLYSATPPSAIVDNAAFNLPSGDRSVYLGNIEIPTPTDLGDTLYAAATAPVNQQIQTAGTAVYGYLVTAGGYTPAANSEVYVNRLSGVGV